MGHGKSSCVIVEADAPKKDKAPTKKGTVEETLLSIWPTPMALAPICGGSALNLGSP